MTARVGTYLSDENIKKLCPLHFMPPGSKTYELFRIASNPQKMAQRPQNPQEAIRAMAVMQNQNIQMLEARYIASLALIKPEMVVPIPSVSRPNQAASFMATTSMGGVAPSGSGAGPSGTNAPPLPPTMPPMPFLQDYNVLTKSMAKSTFKDTLTLARNAGLNIGTFRPSDIDVSMSRDRRTDLFRRLAEQLETDQPGNTFAEDAVNRAMGGSSSGP